ncbi:MAG: response regulator [Verrucomicrobiota bacterium]|nr:response regulator [Verrucomicrobiota bacterium]
MRSRILVVEDEAIVAKDIQTSLVRMGYDVPETAFSWQEAIEFIEKQLPDLVLLDIRIRGEKTGIDVARTIREKWNLPVVFLTAHSDEETLREVREVAPFGYILKPFKERDLRISIDIALNKSRADIQERRANDEKRFRQDLEKIVNGLPGPVLVYDSNLQLVYSNALGSNINPDFHKLPSILQAHINSVLSTGTPVKVVAFKDALPFVIEKERRFFLPSINFLKGNDEVNTVLVALQDVTELSLVNDLKTDLIGTISHELKTPLTTVRMLLHLLEEEKDKFSANHQKVIEVGKSETERMVRVINNLLDLTRFEAGALVINARDVRIKDITDRLVVDYSAQASEKSVRLVVQCDDLDRLYVDDRCLGLALGNLVDNAIKYSQPSTKIEILVVSTQDHVKFCIIDEGPGVSPSNQDRIFDRFVRLSPSDKFGTGLGLAIARQFVQAVNGEISYQTPQNGKGSCFCVEVPRAKGSVS